MSKELATPIKEYSNGLSCGRRATPNGPWILKTQAMEQYRLGRTDFEAIFPVHVSDNPRGGPYDIMKYNECDVRDLADRLHKGEGLSHPSSSVSSAEGSAYATRKGEQITKTNARNRFGLTSSQLERIKPVSRTPNKYNGLTWLYNVCDVEALAEQAGNLTRAPRT
ncbi:hypothetical protein Hypma_010570 [Hypsizygus marmoreus]|uniref:Uncharacterized protein n=1 Tax=Hypsizygus marmoreus TaxID=39966 RepID=A0A369JJ93_HYPMA|nr:hypothetical protein Hypma_010570 [Hypsizygus marmoreus]